MKRVFVIGLDGLSPQIWQRLAAAGWLPRLSKSINAALPLCSTVPPYTPAAWTSIATGLNPGKHGVLDFWQRDVNHSLFSGLPKRKLVSNGIRQAFWEAADLQGFRAGVFNYPLSYPPRRVNGFWSSGMTTPSNVTDYAIPAKLSEAISGFYPDLDMLSNGVIATGQRTESDSALLQKIIDLLDNHIQCGVKALKAFSGEIDLHAFVITATDRFLHYFYNTLPGGDKQASEGLRQHAQRFWLSVDNGISEWLDIAQPDVVIVASDHGFAPSPTHAFNAYKWLQSNGWLKAKLASSPKAILRQLAGLSPGLKTLIRTNLPGSIVSELKRETEERMIAAIDPARTRVTAEVLYGSYLGLTINLRGREATGIVKPGELAKLCDEIMQNALSLHDDDLQPIVRSAKLAADVWQGEFLSHFPDIVLELYPKYGSATGTWDPRLTYGVQPSRQGDHDITGLLAFNQPWQPANNESEDRPTYVWDVAAITLYALGAAIPKHMDGKVPEWIKTSPIQYSSADLPLPGTVEFSADDAEIINRRLRSIGYLE